LIRLSAGLSLEKHEPTGEIGTTVEAIGEANTMTSNKIEAGATLQIPK